MRKTPNKLVPSVISSVVWALFAIALTGGPLAAQTVFHACYVPNTGIMYIVEVEGGCKNARHVPISWTEGVTGWMHHNLNGLEVGDDHPQYLPVDGSRGMTGKLTTTDKIGIGTADPTAPLEILHSTIDHTQPHLRLNSANPSGQNTIDFYHNGRLHSKIRAAGGGDLFIGTHQAGEVRFYTRDEIRMVLSSEGNVGIGTLEPGQKLSVAGVVESTEGGFKFPDGSVQSTAAPDGFDRHSLDAADGNPADALYVDDDGQVGVGTSYPTDNLHILKHANETVGLTIENRNTGDSSAERITFWNEDGGVAGIKMWDAASTSPAVMDIFNNRPNGSIRLNTAGLRRLTVTENGDVGIGTTDPVEKLEVAGNIATEGIKFSDQTVQTTKGFSEITILSQFATIPAGMDDSAIALYCHDAGKVMSGGYQWAGREGRTWAAYPDPSTQYGHRYVVKLWNPTADPLDIVVYAVCVK
jgi:hypothetical protein